MAKIKLGNRPKNFKKTVSFPMLDGTTGTIELVYKYRTRKEFGIFIDGIVEQAKKEAAEERERLAPTESSAEETAERAFSLKEHMEVTASTNVDYILQIVEGWNLDVEFSRESVEQLADEVPAAITTIIETYRAAVSEGRLGN